MAASHIYLRGKFYESDHNKIIEIAVVQIIEIVAVFERLPALLELCSPVDVDVS